MPAVSDEEAKAQFPDGWDAKKPYLRVVKQPVAERDVRRGRRRRGRTPGASSCRSMPELAPGGRSASVEARRGVGVAAGRRRGGVGQADERLGDAVLGGVGGRAHLVEGGGGGRHVAAA